MVSELMNIVHHQIVMFLSPNADVENGYLLCIFDTIINRGQYLLKSSFVILIGIKFSV